LGRKEAREVARVLPASQTRRRTFTHKNHHFPLSRPLVAVSLLVSMQALRLARLQALSLPARRCIATTAPPNAAHVVSTTSSAASSVIPISNVEAQWEKLTHEERATVHQQLEELQKKDWKTLSIDEKKAGTCSSVGAVGVPTSNMDDSSILCRFRSLRSSRPH
jgi:hypothetical protein